MDVALKDLSTLCAGRICSFVKVACTVHVAYMMARVVTNLG